MNLASIAKANDRIISSFSRQSKQHIAFYHDKTIIFNHDKDLIYIPSNTGRLFNEDNSFVSVVTGPYGSGKSTMCVQKIVRRTCSMPYWHNNRRRAKWAVVRNTSGELYSTTLPTWLSWFAELGDIEKRQKPILTYFHRFNDGNGIVELEVLFLALDRPEDIRKIKSLELTGVYLNELSELPENLISHFKGRINGRYPSAAFCNEPYWSGIIADTNPPDVDHFIYKTFEEEKVPGYRIFHQPPGLIKNDNGDWKENPKCDNYENLSKHRDYYTKLATGQKEGFIKVYCLGEYGMVESGKRVYPEYNDDIHSLEDLPAIPGLPIHLGWDFGLTPACIVFQFTTRGQLRVLKEYLSEDMGIRTFAKSIVLPCLQIDFPKYKIGESEADPSGMAGDAIMEELSCIGELNNLGIKTNPASTNDSDVRISSVRFFLNTMIDGMPAFQLSRRYCPTLRKGFMSGYHFKRLSVSGDARYQDKPNKNKFSHPHDALQYGAMKFATEKIINDKPALNISSLYNPVMR